MLHFLSICSILPSKTNFNSLGIIIAINTVMTLETFSLQFDDVYIILNQHQYLKVEDKLTLCMIRYWPNEELRKGCP